MIQLVSLLTALLCPISAFLNIQSFFFPGWIHSNPHGVIPDIVFYLSYLSMLCGIITVVCAWFRMLEKKIKWMTILITFASLMQDIPKQGLYHGMSFCAVSIMLSFIVFALKRYKQYLNRTQVYVYTDYDLSAHQRQLVIVTIFTLGYLVVASFAYVWIEKWTFNDALYFCVTTYATIGFGDLHPDTSTSKLLLPVFATCGIVTVASWIYAIRNVVLETVTLQLKYSIENSLNTNNGGTQHTSPIHTDDEDDEHAPLLKPSDKLHSLVSSTKSPMLVPTTSSFDPQVHRDFDALDLAQIPIMDQLSADTPTIASHRYTASKIGLLPTKQVRVTRAASFPHLSIAVRDHTEQWDIVEVTRNVFYRQIVYAFVGVFLNILSFAMVVSTLENWEFWEGFYFSYCALTTIGFGDYSLSNGLSRALFIWHVIIGIGSITYFSSMIAERAMDQWTVQIHKIEQRMGRYERKAQLKRTYGKHKSPLSPFHVLRDDGFHSHPNLSTHSPNAPNTTGSDSRADPYALELDAKNSIKIDPEHPHSNTNFPQPQQINASHSNEEETNPPIRIFSLSRQTSMNSGSRIAASLYRNRSRSIHGSPLDEDHQESLV